MTHFQQTNISWPTPEQELLLGAALWQGEQARQAWQAWQAKIDWDKHLDPDSYHLMPLLFHNLSSHQIEDPILPKLKGIYRMVWYKNHRALHHLASVLQTFRQAAIQTMLVKGTALAVAHYANYGLRPLSSFEVLVPPAHVVDAIALLQQSGWQLEPWCTHRPVSILLETQVRLTFTNTDTIKPNLHLYWRVLQESRNANADEHFWQTAQATEVNAVPTLTLSPTDQLLQICADGSLSSKDVSISWIADALTILQAAPSVIHWQLLLTLARERLLVLPLREALTYLHGVFAAPIPIPVLRTLQSNATARMERWEAWYLASGYRHRPWGDIPFFWFDYLRSRRRIANHNILWGFIQYLQDRAKAPHLWQLPFSLLLACGRRVGRLFRNNWQ